MTFLLSNSFIKLFQFFGFCATLLYGYDAYLNFRKLKEEKNSVRTVNMPENTTNAPPRNPAY